MIEIIVITYNRIVTLQRTISSLLESELINYKITVIDNCSTDGTSEYLESLSSETKYNLKHIRNVVNIGAVGNVLRAYEMATEKYVWVICDDDEYDFSKVSETILEIKQAMPDVALVGTQVPQNKDSIFTKYAFSLIQRNTKDIVEAAYYFTFLPSAIILRSKLLTCDFRSAYLIGGTNFPQLFWIRNIFDENWSVFVSKHIHVRRPPIDHGLTSDFYHLNGFIEACYLINNMEFRSYLINRLCGQNLFQYGIFISKKLLLDKSNSLINLISLIKHFGLIAPGKRIIFLLCALIFLPVPKAIAKMVIKLKSSK